MEIDEKAWQSVNRTPRPFLALDEKHKVKIGDLVDLDGMQYRIAAFDYGDGNSGYDAYICLETPKRPTLPLRPDSAAPEKP